MAACIVDMTRWESTSTSRNGIMSKALAFLR
jgi:hypothetical protein